MKASFISVNLLYRRLAVILLLAFIFGWLVGAVWPSLFIVCLVMLLWHYHQFNKLYLWLWQSRTLTPPEAKGVWEYIFEGIYRHNKKARKKQKKLQRRIHQFRDGTEALSDAALVVDKDMTIRWVNNKVEALLGIQAKMDIGQRLNNLIRSPQFNAYLQQADFSKACSLPSPIDEFKQLEIRFMPYVDEQTLLLVRDISQLHRVNTMRREFVANVSHELKTPLTVIRGYIEMLITSPEQFDAGISKGFNAISHQVDRMGRLIEQLIELSKVESGVALAKKSVDLTEMMAGITTELEHLNQSKQHTIKLNVAPDLTILGNRTELKSAFLNLITNAINYTPANGEISIELTKQAQQIVFSVTDNGDGIKPQHLARLTERFYRVDDSRNSSSGGSGLGLSIVKHVAKQHQGELKIASTWGKGSTFSLVFG